tara:strand:+ start:10065 stop:10259 length:195 start_codon:yes stop_codon:yes gene_type:complete
MVFLSFNSVLFIGIFLADQLVCPFKRVLLADQAKYKKITMQIKNDKTSVIEIIRKVDIFLFFEK